MSHNSNRFVKGALILAFAGIIAKIISAFYRIPLMNWLGTEVMGDYDTVYPIYALLVSASLVGIPNAVSKLTAEDLACGRYKKAHDIFKKTVLLMVGFGIIATMIIFLVYLVMSQFFEWEVELIYIVAGFAIAPIFISIIGAIRGYFQGLNLMKAPAVAQIIENASKVAVGLVLVRFFLNQEYNSYKIVSGAAIGASTGVIIATIYMVFEYFKERKQILKQVDNDTSVISTITLKECYHKILYLAAPLTVVAAAYSVMRTIDSITVHDTFVSIGHSNDYAKNIIGEMGKAFTIINVPLILQVAISASLVPAVAHANVNENKSELNEKINQGILVALIFALPAAVGLMMLAEPIMYLIYRDASGHIFLFYFGICLVFMILSQVLASILQGISRQFLPLISLICAIMIKVTLNIVLIKLGYGGRGIAIATISFYLVFTLINYIMIKRYTDFTFDVKRLLLKPLLAAGSMGLVIYLVSKILPNSRVFTLVLVGIGALVYGCTLFMTKTLTREELSFMDDNNGIKKLLIKLKLI